MKTVIHRHNSAVGCALLLSACWLSTAKADFPKPIAPHKSGSLTPIGPVSPSSAISNGTAKPQPKTTLADPAHRHVPVLIEQMLQGKITPQKAWKENLLNVDDLLWIFTSYIDPWGSFNWKFDVQIRRELAALLAQYYDHKIETLEKLPSNVRLWLSDYYMSVGDEKTVTIGESILKEIKNKVLDEDALAFQAIERMARYYAAKGKLEKGVQTWLRMADYYAQTSRLVPASLVAVARLYRQMGKAEKAKEIYDKVPQYGIDEFTWLVTLDQTRMFLAKDDYKGAQRFLSDFAKLGQKPELQVHILASLSSVYYFSGQWKEARNCCYECIRLYKTVGVSDDGDLKVSFKAVQETLRLIRNWQETPIICDPPQLSITVSPKDKTFYRRIVVRSFSYLPLTIKSNNDHVTARVLSSNFKQKKKGEVEQEIMIEISAGVIDARRVALEISCGSVENLASQSFKTLVNIEIEPVSGNLTHLKPKDQGGNE